MQPTPPARTRRKPLRPTSPPNGGKPGVSGRGPGAKRGGQHALAWLGEDPAFSALRSQGETLSQLAQALKACRPEAALEVVALRDGVLTLATPEASGAARLRQIGPSLVAALKAKGWRIDSLRIKPRWQGAPPRRRKTIVSPPGSALDEIQRLAQTVQHPGLGAALARLAARHRPDDAA